jgi:hypothetical protein
MGRPHKSPSERAKRLPATHVNRLPWRIDLRSPAAIEIMTEAYLLANDLGGWETLSRQRQLIVARAAYLAVRVTEHESDKLAGRPTTFDEGVHSNQTSLLFGALNKLGLDRQAKPARTLRDVMAGTASVVPSAGSVARPGAT